MKSRMDKYYKEELMQRTTRNDFLYDKLYKDQMPSNNVTVLDGINEIDIDKIKEMINSREGHSKLKSYNKIWKSNESINENIDYRIDEEDYTNYDINEILKKKKNNYSDSPKIRSITNSEYEIMSDLDSKNELDREMLSSEKQLKDLFNTIVSDDGDLFANLKETSEDKEKELDESKEQTFYTSTSKIDTDDFMEEEKKSNIFIVIASIAIIIALIIVVYIKFIK